jgi:hypothetical protein
MSEISVEHFAKAMHNRDDRIRRLEDDLVSAQRAADYWERQALEFAKRLDEALGLDPPEELAA